MTGHYLLSGDGGGEWAGGEVYMSLAVSQKILLSPPSLRSSIPLHCKLIGSLSSIIHLCIMLATTKSSFPLCSP